MPTILRGGVEVTIIEPTLKIDLLVVTVGHFFSESCICGKVLAVDVV